jgi:hypothetical protein
VAKCLKFNTVNFLTNGHWACKPFLTAQEEGTLVREWPAAAPMVGDNGCTNHKHAPYHYGVITDVINTP